jgi:hypothetical protein
MQNKNLYLETNYLTRIQFVIGKQKFESFFFHARLTRMGQLVIFNEVSNDVDTTGTSSKRVVASRVAISYGCPALFQNAI